MILGIVGHEAKKFTPLGEQLAREAIQALLTTHKPNVVVSGRSPLGGIDVWAIEEAKKAGIATQEFPPAVLSWSAPGGFKHRNLQIARASDVVVCIVVDKYPPDWVGPVFYFCYHCILTDHIKSGGCWTTKQAALMGKAISRIVIPNSMPVVQAG